MSEVIIDSAAVHSKLAKIAKTWNKVSERDADDHGRRRLQPSRGGHGHISEALQL